MKSIKYWSREETKKTLSMKNQFTRWALHMLTTAKNPTNLAIIFASLLVRWFTTERIAQLLTKSNNKNTNAIIQIEFRFAFAPYSEPNKKEINWKFGGNSKVVAVHSMLWAVKSKPFYLKWKMCWRILWRCGTTCNVTCITLQIQYTTDSNGMNMN